MDFLDRRTLLGGIGGVAIAALSPTSIAARPRHAFFERTGRSIGLQIYTLGPDAGKDVDATFAQVARIGYREIELPSTFGKKPAELAAAAAKAGLKIASLHLPLVKTGGPMGLTLGSDPAQVADALGALDAKWAVAPILMLPENFRPEKGESFGQALARSVAAAGEDIWKQSAELLNQSATALKPLGIKVGYHNHNIEFAPVGKMTGWDILLRETDPGLVYFEVDTGWVATAGLDVVQFLKTVRGRARLMHVKDVAVGNPQSFAISMKPAEVGSGTLDWSKILPAARKAGIEHFLVEQEPPFEIPRIDSAAKSYAFLSKLKA